jgi:glycosyltransferase involved in cell wall biosynthesis
MSTLDILTAVLIGAVVYCYALYPVMIQLYARARVQPWRKDAAYTPSISIVVAVHNEEKVLSTFLSSLLSLEYPSENVEILIASDGSSDGTNEIIETYAARHLQIKPIFFADQRGKIPVINDAVRVAKGEILFFADADVTFSPNTLLAHAQHYVDRFVGAVAGDYQISKEVNTIGSIERQYASLEQRVRICEGQIASAINVSGANYSMRRTLWRDFPHALACDDLYIVLSVIEQGKRVIADPHAIAYERHGRTLVDEFPRKVRSASRGYRTLGCFPKVVFGKMPESVLLWSHKVLRWLSPLFLIVAGIASSWAYDQSPSIFHGTYLCGLAFLIIVGSLAYTLAWHQRSLPIFGRISWFAVMNFAYLVGAWKYLMRTDTSIWKQT